MSRILGFVPIEELNQERRQVNEEEHGQLNNEQEQQFQGNLNLNAQGQAEGPLHAQGQAVVARWTQKRKDFLKKSLNLRAVKHFPEKSVLTDDYGSKFNSRIKSDIKRLEKQRDTSSRLYRKKENASLIASSEKKVREQAFSMLSSSINIDQKLCDKEDLCDLAAFMDVDKNKAVELTSLFLDESELVGGRNVQEALDRMLQVILAFNLGDIRLDNDTELAGNGAKLESLTWKIAAFDRLSEKYRYFDQLDADTQKKINNKLDCIRAVSDYYIIRKDIITDPMYKSHYNDELSMDFTRAETPQQTELAQKLLRAHIAGRNMMRKNGASVKLIKSKGEPKFKDSQKAKMYITGQEYLYQNNLEVQSIRNRYLKSVPMDKAEGIVRLMEKRKEADRLSKQNSLIPVVADSQYSEMKNSKNLFSGVSEKQWKQSGGATYKKMMTKEDADRIVKKSKGFLTAVETDGGLMEIKPSLPEEVTVKGKKIHLRKLWNLMVKTAITLVTDEEGNFKTDEESQRKGYMFTELISFYGRVGTTEEEYDRNLKEVFAPVMEQILKKGYKNLSPDWAQEAARTEAEELCKEFKLLLEENRETGLIPGEVDLDGYVKNIRSFNQISEEAMKGYLKGYKIREVKTVRKVVNGETKFENIVEEREATEEEIQAAVDGIRKDVTDMKGAVKKLRDLDVDSKVIPIPNTCSSNAIFCRNLQKISGEKNSDIIEYRVEEYIRENPQKVLDYLKENIYLLADAQEETELDIKGYVSNLNKLSFKENRDGLSKAELEAEDEKIKKLVPIAKKFAKFEYHVAAHIFGDDEDGDLTVEGFAAESSQYMVEPFSMNAAIGQYKGTTENKDKAGMIKKQEGFSGYYNTDNPYASNSVDLLKIYLNLGLKRHSDDFEAIVRQKEEAEAERRRQQEEAEAEKKRKLEQERREREERERIEREEKERLEREEKERKEQEEKECLEREEKERLEQAKKKFENLSSDPDAMDEFFIAQSNDEYFKNKEDQENAEKDAKKIKELGIEDEVRLYTGEDYAVYNDYLRDIDTEKITDEQKEEVARLKNGLSKCKIDRTVVVNRGTWDFKVLTSMLGLKRARGASSSEVIKQALDHINDLQKEGKDIILTDPGFISTCYDANNKYTDRMMPKGIEFVIKVNKGTSAANISKAGIHADEKELLLNAGTKFRLIKVYNAGPDDIEGLERRKATCDLIGNRENSKKGECLKIYLETIPNEESGVLKQNN